MHTDGTDHLQAPAWAADLLRHLGAGGPLTAGALTERLQARHPGLTAEQVERALRARCEVHETAAGWMSLLALADGAVLSHLLGPEERKAGVLAGDGDLDLWARLADQGLPLAGGGMLRARWALSPHELPRGSNSALAGPEGWLEAFEDDTILTLRLRDGALEVSTLAEQQGDEPGVEVADLSTEEIRLFTLARGFLWTQEADRVSAEELDRFLTVLTLSPLVLERVADEVERNPADAALLEAARRAAATPVQRAAAVLLAARAAEGDGRPVEAEELVLEALGHDPDLAPALRDAADYAATRGDAVSADSSVHAGAGALCQHRDLCDSRLQHRDRPGVRRAGRAGGRHVRARPGDLRGRRPR